MEHCVQRHHSIWTPSVREYPALKRDIETSLEGSVARLVIDAGASGGAMFYFRDTEQPINKSVCAIDSLEVYRGREQAIKISHDGFTLSNSGAFEVSHQILFNSGQFFIIIIQL